jgi:hypothetical protein
VQPRHGRISGDNEIVVWILAEGHPGRRARHAPMVPDLTPCAPEQIGSYGVARLAG